MRKLKAYIFDISPYQYGSGFIVVIAYTLPQARRLAAEEKADGTKPEAFIDYKICSLDKPQAIHYHCYAE